MGASQRALHQVGCSRARVTMPKKNLRFSSLEPEIENNRSNQCDVKRNRVELKSAKVDITSKLSAMAQEGTV